MTNTETLRKIINWLWLHVIQYAFDISNCLTVKEEKQSNYINRNLLLLEEHLLEPDSLILCWRNCSINLQQ